MAQLRFKILFFFVFLLSLAGNAQQLIRSVVASAGKEYVSAGFSLWSNTGEPIAETFTSGTNFLTQGFVQPQQFVLLSSEKFSNDLGISFFPNPVIDEIHIVVNQAVVSPFVIYIVDVQGHIIENKSAAFSTGTKEISLNLETLSSGFYFIRVVDASSGNVLKVSKLIKL